MAIATGTALALGATALASGASAAMGASASKKASNAAERSAAESAALQREMYDKNANALAPYQQGGAPAVQQINALLGLGTGPASGGAIGGSGGADWNQYLQANPDVLNGFYTTADRSQFASPTDYAQFHYQKYGANEGRGLPGVTSAAGPAGTTSSVSPEQAFDTFRNSTGYQFRLNEGQNAVRGGFSGSGTLQSGAALKALQSHGQGMASAEFGNYLGALGNQQAMGLSAASAQAGVGQNFANSMTQINGNRADTQGNAALLNAQNTGNALSGLASTAGYLAGRGRI